MKKQKIKLTIAIITVVAITAYFVMRTPAPFSAYESERYYLLYSSDGGDWKTFGRKQNKGYSEEQSCLYELRDELWGLGSKDRFSCAKGDEMVITDIVVTEVPGYSYNKFMKPIRRIYTKEDRRYY